MNQLTEEQKETIKRARSIAKNAQSESGVIQALLDLIAILESKELGLAEEG